MEFPIAELPVTTITRLHYTHITAADNALVSILEISNFDIDVEVITDNWTQKFEPHGGQISKP